MSKENHTAASKAHAPEKIDYRVDQPHARNYPGKKHPKPEKVVEATQHDAGALARGRSLSMGTSADGSHKGLPASYEFVGHKAGKFENDKGDMNSPDVNKTPKHDSEELAGGKSNSMGTSADGSHKGLPAEYKHVGQV